MTIIGAGDSAREETSGIFGTLCFSSGKGGQGEHFTDILAANLGSALNWTLPGNGQWSGRLTGGAQALAFSIRESELAPAVHTPGGQGALILALESELPPDATLEVTGAQSIGSTGLNGKTTHLFRITAAGVKLIRLRGAGAAQLRLSVAGDLNRDGRIDGTDSALWEQGKTAVESWADLTGNGQIDNADRQILYADTGFQANQAPVAVTGSALKTHTDLAARSGLQTLAEDREGDSLFWRLLDTSHGTARLNADGQTLTFSPEAGSVPPGSRSRLSTWAPWAAPPPARSRWMTVAT